MKKTYIIPFVIIEPMESDSELLNFSNSNGQAIGENDNITNTGQLGDGTIDNEKGDGMNGAKGATFVWDDDLF